MEKAWFMSKTIQGIIVSLIGGALMIFNIGAEALGQSILVTGLGWAGIGFRLKSGE